MWNPKQAGEVFVTLADKLMKGEEIKDGDDIEGLGVIQPDFDNRTSSSISSCPSTRTPWPIWPRWASNLAGILLPGGDVQSGSTQMILMGTHNDRDHHEHGALTPLLSLRNINMTFGGIKALKNVSFDVLPGEVHCLAGENGSGKRR